MHEAATQAPQEYLAAAHAVCEGARLMHLRTVAAPLVQAHPISASLAGACSLARLVHSAARSAQSLPPQRAALPLERRTPRASYRSSRATLGCLAACLQTA